MTSERVAEMRAQVNYDLRPCALSLYECRELLDALAVSQARVERLTAALAWYADADNYEEGLSVARRRWDDVHRDRGQRARAALDGAPVEATASQGDASQPNA